MARSCRESRQDSRREAKFPAAKISPGSCRKSRQDSRREAKIPAAKISAQSCRESHHDSHREAIIPAAKIWQESYREPRQDSRREVLPGISPRLAMGREIVGEIPCRSLGKILDMLPPISFGSSPMFTCLRLIKIQTKVS